VAMLSCATTFYVPPPFHASPCVHYRYPREGDDPGQPCSCVCFEEDGQQGYLLRHLRSNITSSTGWHVYCVTVTGNHSEFRIDGKLQSFGPMIGALQLQRLTIGVDTYRQFPLDGMIAEGI
jgi:hypothetical protein